jgi:hypothetical protein
LEEAEMRVMFLVMIDEPVGAARGTNRRAGRVVVEIEAVVVGGRVVGVGIVLVGTAGMEDILVRLPLLEMDDDPALLVPPVRALLIEPPELVTEEPLAVDPNPPGMT